MHKYSEDLYRKGVEYLKKRNFIKSEKCFEEVKNTYPTNKDILKNLAICYFYNAKYKNSEKNLEEFFRSYNFSILHPEELTILEQIKIFRLAKILIAPYGAAWANAIFRGQNTHSLMLSTKYTPEFSRIFQYLGIDLSVLNLIPVKVRDEKNISKSYNFNVGENEFEMLIKYLKYINTDKI